MSIQVINNSAAPALIQMMRHGDRLLLADTISLFRTTPRIFVTRNRFQLVLITNNANIERLLNIAYLQSKALRLHPKLWDGMILYLNK